MSVSLSEKDVIDILTPVKDPEIGVSIVRLGMVHKVEIDGNDVRVIISLTIPSCPLGTSIQNDVKEALVKSKLFKNVNVELRTMSDNEREAMISKLKISKPKYVNEYDKKKSQVVVPPVLNDLKKDNIKYLIPVGSGKGGVGKSSVTALLAVELSRRGYKVGIMDADITGSSIAKIFGVKGPMEVQDNTIIPPSTPKYGIKLISTNMLLEKEDQPVIWRGPIVSQMINQFYKDVDWGTLDFLLLDMPPGTSDIPLTVFQQLPIYGMLFVQTPQDLASLIVKKAINMAKAMNVKSLGIIENMSYVVCPHCNSKIKIWGKDEVAYDLPLLGKIPIEEGLSDAMDKGKLEEYKELSNVKLIGDRFLYLLKQ